MALSRLSAATVRLIAAASASYSDAPVVSRKLDFLLTSASRPFLLNWLQVLGTTETPHIDQGVVSLGSVSKVEMATFETLPEGGRHN